MQRLGGDLADPRVEQLGLIGPSQGHQQLRWRDDQESGEPGQRCGIGRGGALEPRVDRRATDAELLAQSADAAGTAPPLLDEPCQALTLAPPLVVTAAGLSCEVSCILDSSVLQCVQICIHA